MRYILPLFFTLALSAGAFADDADPAYCVQDEDCAAAECCHTPGYVNKKFAPSCEGVMCTMACIGPYDCVGAEPKCEDHRCTGSTSATQTILPPGAASAVH